jgi:hypothetical protein
MYKSHYSLRSQCYACVENIAKIAKIWQKWQKWQKFGKKMAKNGKFLEKMAKTAKNVGNFDYKFKILFSENNYSDSTQNRVFSFSRQVQKKS